MFQPAAVRVRGSCVTRSYGHGSVVCVCDAWQCGVLGGAGDPGGSLEEAVSSAPAAADSSPYLLFTSTKAGLRLRQTAGNFTNGYASRSRQPGPGPGPGSQPHGEWVNAQKKPKPEPGAPQPRNQG